MKLLIVSACIVTFFGAIMEADTELAVARNHPDYGMMAHFMGVMFVLSYVILIAYSLNRVFE